MRTFFSLLLALGLASTPVLMMGCDNDSPAEDAVEEIEDAVEDSVEEIEDK